MIIVGKLVTWFIEPSHPHRAIAEIRVIIARITLSFWDHGNDLATSSYTIPDRRKGGDDDDDELMLNVLRCHLTY